MPSVDNRVVEMRFDNREFESGVKTSLSTLDKLKAALKLDGAAKGLEQVENSAKSISFVGLSSAIDAVNNKFSVFGTFADQIVRRIADQVYNLEMRFVSLVKSMSVDQITAGWNKYVDKTASVQTIMNATGKSIDDVNEYLDKLMWYSDETSFGFTEMTSALGQMTSSGGDINKIIPMLMGIGNATAFAGKGSAEFSRMIYNLNQSYGAGSLQYMDWKSLENAGVASEQLKQVFIDTGIALGKIHEGQVTVANFGTTLKDKWADTEVMEQAFGRFAEMTEKAYDLVNEGQFDTASDAYEYLATQYDGVAITAAKAAQEAKSFTEAIDATKDAVSSGWMKTFELIFGNYEEAKVLWTDLANELWEVFASGAEDRNETLQQWHDGIDGVANGISGYTMLMQTLENAWSGVKSIIYAVKEALADVFPPTTAQQLLEMTEAALAWSEGFKNAFTWIEQEEPEIIKPFANTRNEATGLKTDLEDVEAVAQRVLAGDFGNGDERRRQLEELGYSYAAVQNKVNELCGSNVRLEETEEGVAEGAAKAGRGLEGMYTDSGTSGKTQRSADAILNLQRIVRGLASAVDIVRQAVSAAWTVVIKPALHAAKTALSPVLNVVGDLADRITEFAAKAREENFFETKLQSFVDWVTRLKDRWDEFKASVEGLESFQTFVGYLKDIKDWAVGLATNAFDTIASFLSNLGDADGSIIKMETLTSVADGFFKILNWISGAIKTVWSYLEGVYDSIDWEGVFDYVGNAIQTIKTNWDEFKASIQQSEAFQTFIQHLREIKDWASGFVTDGFDAIINFFNNLGSTSDEPLITLEDITGAANSLLDSINWIIEAVEAGWPSIQNLFQNIDLSSVQSFFDSIYQPAKNFILGLFSDNDITGSVTTLLDNVWVAVKNWAAGVDVWEIISLVFKGVTAASFASMLTGIGNFFSGLGDLIGAGADFPAALVGVLNSVKSTLSGFAFGLKAFALIEVAGAIWILSQALIGLSQLDTEKLMNVAVSLLPVAAAIAIVLNVIGKLNGGSLNIGGKNNNSGNKVGNVNLDLFKGLSSFAQTMISIGAAILSVGAAIFLVSRALKTVDQLSNIQQSINAFMWMLAGIAGALVIPGIVSSLGKNKVSWGKIGFAFTEIAAALLIVSFAMRSLNKVKPEVFSYAFSVFGSFIAISGIIMAVMGAVEAWGTNDVSWGKIGFAFIELSAAMLLLAGAIRSVANVPIDEAIPIFNRMLGMVAVMGILIGALGFLQAKVEGVDYNSIGLAFIEISGSLLILSVAIRALAETNGDMTAAAIALGVFFAAFVGAGALVGLIPAIGSGLTVLSTAILAFGAGIALAGVGALAFAAAINVFAASTENARQAGVNLAEAIIGFFDTLMAKGQSIIEFVGLVVLAVIAVILAKKAYIALAGSELVMSFIGAISGKLPVILTVLGVVLGSILEWLGVKMDSLLTAVVALVLVFFDDLALAIINNGPNLRTAIESVLMALGSMIANALLGIFSWLLDIIDLAFPGTKEKIESFVDNGGEAMIAAIDENKTAAEKTLTDATNELKEATEIGMDEINNVAVEKSNKIADDTLASLLGPIESGQLSVEEAMAAIADVFGDSLSDIPGQANTYSSDYVQNVLSQLASGQITIEDAIQLIQDSFTPPATIGENGSQTASDYITSVLGGLQTGEIDITSALEGIGANFDISSTTGGYGTDSGEEWITGMLSGVQSGEIDLSTGVDGILNYLNVSDDTLVYGQDAMSNYASGISNNTYQATNAAEGAASSVSSSLSGVDSEYIGQQMMVGMANGITNHTWRVTTAAGNAAALASRTMKNIAQIASPSRVTMQIGQYMSEGLAIGIENRTPMVGKASEKISNVAINSMSSVAESIGSAFDENYDYSPTITPVVDLSNVTGSAQTISDLFGTQTLDVAANLDSISAQNTSIVDTINAIRNDIYNLGSQISKLKIVMDNGTLVGQIIDPIDSELAHRQIMAGRGG